MSDRPRLRPVDRNVTAASRRPSRRTALGVAATALGTTALLGAADARPAPAAPSPDTDPPPIAPNPALAGPYGGTPAVFARTADDRLLMGTSSEPDGTGWSLEQIATDVIGDPRATSLTDGRRRVAARTSTGLLVATETAEDSGTYDTVVHPQPLDDDPALTPEALFVTAEDSLMQVDPDSGETTGRGGTARGPVSAGVEHTLNGTDLVAVADGPDGLVVVRRFDGDWSSFTSSRPVPWPQLSIYSLRGAVTTWIAGVEDGVLIAGMLSSTGEQPIDWQEVDTGVTGLPTADATYLTGNRVATVHEDGELRETTLTQGDPVPRTLLSDAVGEPSLGYSQDGHALAFAHDAAGDLWLVQRGSQSEETARIAEATTGRVSVADGAEQLPVLAVTSAAGELVIGPKHGPGAGDWTLEFVTTGA